MKPAPADSQDLYLGSLRAIGIDPLAHDIRFVEDDWESPTLGAWGLGWEVWCDGMEVSQFTYFQQVGGIDCDPVPLELTYGLERLVMYVQGVDHFRDIDWDGVIDWDQPLEPVTLIPTVDPNITLTTTGTRVQTTADIYNHTLGGYTLSNTFTDFEG